MNGQAPSEPTETRLDDVTALDALPVGTLMVDDVGHAFFRVNDDPAWICEDGDAWSSAGVLDEADDLTIVHLARSHEER